ncbi:MAG: hypothetical protein MRY83_06325 [Flavobacteriales bacterium]|nr:hypothetical protein [Flavobacteriales bacterium]
MKKLVAIAFAGMMAFGITSCSKCVECTYFDNGGIQKSAESCGKKFNEDLETDLSDQWGQYGAVTCADK